MGRLLRLAANRAFDMPPGFLRVFDLACAMLFGAIAALQWPHISGWLGLCAVSAVMAASNATWHLQQGLRRGLRSVAVAILLRGGA
jgi:hypothetical protein